MTLLLYDTWLWLDACSGVWFCCSGHLLLPYSSPARGMWECRMQGSQAAAKSTSGTVIDPDRGSLWADVQWHLSLPHKWRWSVQACLVWRWKGGKMWKAQEINPSTTASTEILFSFSWRTGEPCTTRRKSESINSCALRDLTFNCVLTILIIFFVVPVKWQSLILDRFYSLSLFTVKHELILNK